MFFENISQCVNSFEEVDFLQFDYAIVVCSCLCFLKPHNAYFSKQAAPPVDFVAGSLFYATAFSLSLHLLFRQAGR
jgi:hypothetical protein